MRLVLFYYSQGNSPGLEFRKDFITENKFANNFYTEGLYTLFQELIKQNIIDECSIVIESGVSQGYKQLCKGIDCYVVPNINQFLPYLNEEDIIFVRGGFKWWFETLIKFEQEKRWLWLYAANTGRAKWPFWDIVFDDLKGYNYIDKNNRVYLYYRKPINQNIFKYIPNTKQKYDLMIGASHIHDKKGQWRVVEMLANIKHKYGVNPKCILPGAIRRGVNTNNLIQNINRNRLNVDVVGMLSREELAVAMNETKVFYHGGAGGQNDRGPLEALACGCITGISNPAYHSPIVYKNAKVSFIGDTVDQNKTELSLHYLLSGTRFIDSNKKIISDYFNQECGIKIVAKDFKKLIDFFKRNPKRNRQALKYEYGL